MKISPRLEVLIVAEDTEDEFVPIGGVVMGTTEMKDINCNTIMISVIFDDEAKKNMLRIKGKMLDAVRETLHDLLHSEEFDEIVADAIDSSVIGNG